MTAASGARTDARNAAVLQRRMAIRLTSATIPEALDAITQASGLRFAYQRDAFAAATRVSLKAEEITVAAALTVVLMDAGVDVELVPDGMATLVPHAGLVAGHHVLRQGGGIIAGRVTDAATHAPLDHVAVRIEGSASGGVTTSDGRYAMRNVPPGTYRVTARRVGYTPLSKDVTVAADQQATMDFSLTRAAQALEEVVTTVTGNDKRYRVGNLIETLRADSVVQTAPVTDLGDVLNARVPGVQVFNVGGVTGASPQINIRGQNSLSGSNQPLLVIDGVRAENSGAAQAYGDPANPTASIGVGGALPYFSIVGGRLNDLNPEEIESIEVVKGPSAATLYGTDAANGVILVTTKRGVAGPPRWDVSSEQGALTVSTGRFLDSWRAWGHTTDGTNTPEQCTLLLKAAGSCVIDSVTHYSPLKDPATTPFTTGERERYTAQVSGGRDARYFVGGTYESETAPIVLPAPDRVIVLQQFGRGGLTPDATHPNALTKGSARVNVSSSLNRALDLSISSGLLSQETRLPNTTFVYTGQVGSGYRDVFDGWGSDFRPAYAFDLRDREDVTHMTGSANATWHPTTWFQGRATTGIDHSSNYLDFLVPSTNPFYYFGAGPGQRSNARINTDLYSVDVGGTVSAALGPAISSKTSVGAQYNHRAELSNAAIGRFLAPGVQSVSGGAAQAAMEANIETIVTGGYAEQQFGLRDRLFLTGAVRVDGGSAFGAAFKTQAYPKVSASWLVSRESWSPRIPGISSFRLRAAYGSSGVQPAPTAALAQVALAPATVPSGTVSGGTLSSLGNPDLKAETQTEFEAGGDIEAFNSRVQVTATYYDKKSADALISLPLPAQLGVGSYGAYGPDILSVFQETNIGAVRNRGYEIAANVEVLRGRFMSWSVGANGSNNQNRLLSLEPGLSAVRGDASQVGLPLFGLYAIPYTFKDKNGDGIIEPNEVTATGGLTFMGSTYPTGQLTFQSTVGLWRDAVQLRVQVDRRSGVLTQDAQRQIQTYLSAYRGQNDPHASLSEQAAAQAADGPVNSNAAFYEDGSFTRLREVSITFNVPPRFLQALHRRDASVTFAGRNLALWTRYGGADPEVNGFPASNAAGSGGGRIKTTVVCRPVTIGSFVRESDYDDAFYSRPPERTATGALSQPRGRRGHSRVLATH